MSRYSGAPSPVLVVVDEDEGRAPVLLTRIGARKLTEDIKEHLTSALIKLRQAREGEAHIVLGYPDWHTYCEREFGTLSDLALPVVERRELVASMRATRPPLSHEEIGRRLGVSVGTVYKDRKAIGSAEDLPEPRALSAVPEPPPDPAPPPDYSGLYKTDHALLLVRDEEDRGLTSVELDHQTGWDKTPGLSSGTLSRLKRRGLVEPTGPVRGNRAAHLITAKGRVLAGKLDDELAARAALDA